MTKITKEKFEAYVRVQKSGVTNMWAVDLVGQLSGLEKEEILDIMKNYGKYKKEFAQLVKKSLCAICAQPEDEDGRCGCTNKDAR